MARYCVIDTETTGLDPNKGLHRVVEVSAAEVIDGVITGNCFTRRANLEGQKSNPKVLVLHGVSDESLESAAPFSDFSSVFYEFIQGATLVFYNRVFDLKFLKSELERCKDRLEVEDNDPLRAV